MLDHSATRHVARVLAVAQDGSKAGGSLDANIARSWERCAATYGLDPAKPREPLVLEHTRLKECRERLEDVLDIASYEMTNLYQQISGSGYAILLTDSDGVIVNCVSDPELVKVFNRAGLGLGAIWSEQSEGTNGIGTCLAEKQPVTVHRDEHFRSRHTNLTCSASPIFDPHGKLLAVLDASSANCRDSKQSQFHTVALTTMAAKLIENCNFLHSFRNQWVLRFHNRPEFVGLLSEGMLAFDGNGRILAVNQSAMNQLDASNRQRLMGRSVMDVFAMGVDALMERASRHPSTVWPIRDQQGRNFYARLRGTETKTLPPPPARPARAPWRRPPNPAPWAWRPWAAATRPWPTMCAAPGG